MSIALRAFVLAIALALLVSDWQCCAFCVPENSCERRPSFEIHEPAEEIEALIQKREAVAEPFALLAPADIEKIVPGYRRIVGVNRYTDPSIPQQYCM